MLILIAAPSSSKYPPSGPVMKTMLWIPSVMDEPGTHCPVSSQMYACLVSTLTPSAPRQPPAPLPTRTFEPGWVTVAVVGVAGVAATGVPGRPPEPEPLRWERTARGPGSHDTRRPTRHHPYPR